MRSSLPVNSEKGISLVGVLMLVGLLGIASIGIVTWNKQKLATNRQINVQSTAEQIKQKLLGAVISPDSWAATSGHNSSAFSSPHVLSTATAVSTDLYPSLDLYLSNGSAPPTLLYRSTDPQAGFNLQGDACSPFNSVSGNDECPFRYEVKLIKHQMQNTNWIDTIRFELSFKPATLNMVLNTGQSLFSFNIDRNFDAKSIETSCVALSGNYTSGKCSVMLTPVVTCSSGAKAFAGLSSGGSASGGSGGSTSGCESPSISPVACGSNSAISGFSSSGSPQCVSL